jgi:hypothetical protein
VRQLERSLCTFVFMIALLPAGLAAPAPEAAPAAARYEQIDDLVLQMPAGLLVIPADWQMAGVVARPQGCHGAGPYMKYIAQAPDGVTAIEYLPGVSWWAASNFNPNQPRPPGYCYPEAAASAEEFLRDAVLTQLRPGAQIIGVEDFPPERVEALRAELENMQAQNAAEARRLGLAPHQITHEGKRIRIRYERGGQPVEELIGAIVTCTTARMPGNMVTGPWYQRLCGSNGTLIQRAPAGRFDPQLFSSVRLITNPAWGQEVAARMKAASDAAIARSWEAHNNMMAASNAAAAARTAEWAAGEKARAESVQHSLDNARAQQAAQDRAARDFSNGILGQSTYTDPGTGRQIVTGNQYKNVYLSRDGHTILKTDDPEDPNRNPLFTDAFTEMALTH